jgi:uncharacterized protein YegL
MSKVNLLKERENKIVVSLQKKNVNPHDVMCKVALVLDVSGSMSNKYMNGLVQTIIERIYPIASKFDDNKELDLWIFSNKFQAMKPVSINNFENYVVENIMSKNIPCLWGGTEYAPVMQDVNKNYSKSGFFGKQTKEPAYVIFITDGDNFDKEKAEKIIRESSKNPIFWQFVGIGRDSFDFLKKLDDLTDRFIDNANFFQLNDISKISDEELYDRLLNEFPLWMKEARGKGIVK